MRGDVNGVASVAGLMLQQTAGGTGGAALNAGLSGTPPVTTTPQQSSGTPVLFSTSELNPWSVSPKYVRVAHVASVYSGSSDPARVLVRRPALRHYVERAENDGCERKWQLPMASSPRCRNCGARYPSVDFAVLNVQGPGLYRAADPRGWRDARARHRPHLHRHAVLFAVVAQLDRRLDRDPKSSLFMAFTIMKLANFTIDTVSLLAMTLIIGILVDDSIVVIENIERHYERGEAPRTSAILGRSEIGAAVIVITIVDVVVFLPIAFLPGITGKCSWPSSPSSSSRRRSRRWPCRSRLRHRWPGTGRCTQIGGRGASSNAFSQRFERLALVVLDTRDRLGAAPRAARFRGQRPHGRGGRRAHRRRRRWIRIHAVGQPRRGLRASRHPTGTPLSVTNAAIGKLSAEISQQPDVQAVTGTAGSSQQSFGGSLNVGSAGQLHVFLRLNRKQSTEYWAHRFGIMGAAAAPGADVSPFRRPEAAVEISSRSIFWSNRSTKTRSVRRQSAGRTAGHAGHGARHEFAPAAVAPGRRRLRPRSRAGARYRHRHRRQCHSRDVRRIARHTVRNVQRHSIRAGRVSGVGPNVGAGHFGYPDSRANGSLIRVGDIATLVQDPVEPIVTRTNRQTVIHLSANVAPGYALSAVQKAARARFAALHLPDTVSIIPAAGGQQANLSQTIAGMGVALALSLLLVYLLMLALYDSYRIPFIVMFAVPVAAVGAIGALALTRQTLNLFSLIGTILLIGLVSKNGILLVDFANNRIRAGMDRVAAIRQSAHERFRPIVMTTAAMVAGMLPLALALEPGSAQRQSLGVVVIGGLLSSLLLTLVVVPVAFVRFAPRYRPRPEPIPPPMPIPAGRPCRETHRTLHSPSDTGDGSWRSCCLPERSPPPFW